MIEKNEDKSEQEYVYALCINARATSHFQYKIHYNPLYPETSHKNPRTRKREESDHHIDR